MAKSKAAKRDKNRSRPRKGEAGKKRRVKVQKARLVKLGLPAAEVERLDSKNIRALLRRPAAVRKALAG